MDLLTKALKFNQFSSLVCKMGMINIHSAVTFEGEYQNEGHKLKQEQSGLIEEDRSHKGTYKTEMKLNNIDCSLKHEK